MYVVRLLKIIVWTLPWKKNILYVFDDDIMKNHKKFQPPDKKSTQMAN